jgi:hypothetical protein
VGGVCNAVASFREHPDDADYVNISKVWDRESLVVQASPKWDLSWTMHFMIARDLNHGLVLIAALCQRFAACAGKLVDIVPEDFFLFLHS